MNDFDEELEPLFFRFSGKDNAIPVVPVKLMVEGGDPRSQIVNGILRPDLPVSKLSVQWADALDHSHGGPILVDIAMGYGEDAKGWGPCNFITPDVEPSLDEQITDDGVGGMLLGRDHLSRLTVAFIGPANMFVLTKLKADE